ncbi:MAG: hypothetical protein QOG31_1919, partial [Thermoplasmata archaeon]|nr:hypothetical protein [Thermoplasmata archaeon]
ELCRREAHDGKNQVCINLSAASKLAAFAAGLGGMAYQYTKLVRFYYVQPQSYAEEERTIELRKQAFLEHGMSIGVKAIQWIDPLPLNQPGRVEMQVLAFLSRHPGATYLEVVRHLIPHPKSPLGKPYADLLEPDVAKRLKWTQSKEAVQAHQGSTKATGLLRPLRNKAVTSLRRITAPLEKLDLVRHSTRGREGILELTPKGRMYALLARDEQE